MDHITQNSSPLDALRPAKFPYPDADFFMAFVPEAVFALVVGTLAALAYWHFSRLILVCQKEDEAFQGKITVEDNGHYYVLHIQPSDPNFEDRMWHWIRYVLIDKKRYPEYWSMTTVELLHLTKNKGGLESVLRSLDEWRYSKKVFTLEEKDEIARIVRSVLIDSLEKQWASNS